MSAPTPAMPGATALCLETTEVDGVAWLRISGALTIRDAWRVREIDADRWSCPVVVDLSDVSDLDVAGIAAVTAVARHLISNDRRVEIIRPRTNTANRLAEMTGVFELVNRLSPAVVA